MYFVSPKPIRAQETRRGLKFEAYKSRKYTRSDPHSTLARTTFCLIAVCGTIFCACGTACGEVHRRSQSPCIVHMTLCPLRNTHFMVALMRRYVIRCGHCYEILRTMEQAILGMKMLQMQSKEYRCTADDKKTKHIAIGVRKSLASFSDGNSFRLLMEGWD
jgi:hypothetical protein